MSQLKTKMMRVSEKEQALIRLIRSSDKQFILDLCLEAFSRSDSFQLELNQIVESADYDLINYLAFRANIWRQFGIALDDLTK